MKTLMIRKEDPEEEGIQGMTLGISKLRRWNLMVCKALKVSLNSKSIVKKILQDAYPQGERYASLWAR